MKTVKIEEDVINKYGNVTVKKIKEYIIPDKIPCVLDETVDMIYNEKTRCFETEECGGVIMHVEDYIINEISLANEEAEEEKRCIENARSAFSEEDDNDEDEDDDEDGIYPF